MLILFALTSYDNVAPARTRSLLRQVQHIELPSLNESESGKESDETGITARHKEVFQVPVHALHEGDITLVEPANDGGELVFP